MNEYTHQEAVDISRGKVSGDDFYTQFLQFAIALVEEEEEEEEKEQESGGVG